MTLLSKRKCSSSLNITYLLLIIHGIAHYFFQTVFLVTLATIILTEIMRVTYLFFIFQKSAENLLKNLIHIYENQEEFFLLNNQVSLNTLTVFVRSQ